ncbi:MAG: AMP-binding protein, partial [bacterium]|nr:AMP-binding protein [bacterium]
MNKAKIPGELAFVASQYGKERSYWLKKLEGDFSKSFFPYDYEFPLYSNKEGKSTGESITFKFHEKLNRKLITAMNNSDSRLHMLLTAALVLLLYKYTGNSDIIIGTPIDKQEIEADFVNILLALRSKLEKNMTFRELLIQVRKTTSEARENQNYPIETIPNDLNMAYSPDEDFPLFDIVITVENIQDKKHVRTPNINPGIIFAFLRTGDDIEGVVHYNPSLYDKKSVRLIIDYYIRLTWNALTNADSKLMDISILSDEEETQLVIDNNETAAEYPAKKTIHQLFEEQAARTPGNTAIEIAAADSGPTVKENEKNVTYVQLNDRAHRLARLLRKKGVRTGTIVGLMYKPSLEAVVAILGILKAGAAYMPIDPENPETRIRFFLEDVCAPLLLAPRHLLDEKKNILKIYPPANIICPGEFLAREKNETLEEKETPGTTAGPSDTAYVIYTSGTTGKPKGVAVEHRGLVNYIWWAAANYVKETPLNFPLYTSLAFDLTVTSIFTPLITGSTILVYEGEDKVGLIEKIIDDKKTAVIKITPSHLKLIVDKKSQDSTVERFILGGEALDTMIAGDTLKNFGGSIEIVNEYGPTEAVVGCMKHIFNPAEDTGKSVPLGSPVANAKIYILDGNMKPVPIGVKG